MEDVQDFEGLFHQAVAARGPAYVEAREKLLAMAGRPAVLARLRSHQQSTDPGQALVAIVLVGRLEKPDAYRKAENSIDGDYPKERYSRGRIILDDPEWRVRDARKHLGKDVLYLSLELLLKLHKYDDPTTMSWVAAVDPISDAKDKRWNDLLLAVTSDASYSEDEQLDLGYELVRTNDPRILPFYRNYLTSPVPTDSARMAFNSLAKAKDLESVPRLKEIAFDKKMDVYLRQAAIGALATMRIEDAQAILLRILQGLSAKERPLLPSILSGLDDLGDERAITALKRFLLRLKGREDVEDLLNVKGTIDTIQERLAGKANVP